MRKTLMNGGHAACLEKNFNCRENINNKHIYFFVKEILDNLQILCDSDHLPITPPSYKPRLRYFSEFSGKMLKPFCTFWYHVQHNNVYNFLFFPGRHMKFSIRNPTKKTSKYQLSEHSYDRKIRI